MKINKILILIASILFCYPITSSDASVTLQEAASIEKQPDLPIKVGLVRINKVDAQEAEKSVKKIVEFTESDAIKAILVWIDCTGGSAGYAELIARELEICSNTKPVVALVINNCYSGGYLIAASSDYIIAPTNAGIGGIGAVLRIKRYKNIKEVAQNGISADVEYDSVYAGEFKIASQAEAPLFDQQTRAFYQQMIDSAYKSFIEYVARRRNLDLENASSWANGKDFNGQQAVELGLIDQLGGYSDAINKLKSLISSNQAECTQNKLQFIE